MADEVNTNTEGTQDTNTQNTEEKQTTADKGQEKTFTQAEVDKVLGERLARERAKMPSADELKAFGEWKKSQQTEAEKAAEREAQYAKLQADSEALRRENSVIKAGVHTEDAEFVIWKVGKMEGEFDKNLTAFLAENKKYTEPKTETVEGTKHNPSKNESQEERNLRAFMKGAGIPAEGDK
ncbi:MAG: hypothetical protein VB108_01180 [Anaerolineaceae bacterium]|nr:hypothetical protein [Anaerolineaceae bacterium]